MSSRPRQRQERQDPAVHDSSKNERRRYPRHTLHGGLSVELRVEVSGETPALLLTRGTIADISRGGVRCDIDFAVPVGTRVDLSFTDASDGGPLLRCLEGHVARTVSPGGVPDQVAIAFASPLPETDLERLCAGELVQPRPSRAVPVVGASSDKERRAFTAW